MHTLFPPIKTYAEHRVSVNSIHQIYVEECGNPDGLPVLVIHSGPGAGGDSYYRRFFDPERYRIILFDQRGCGRSRPFAELKDNTTDDLVKDMETIRAYLKIDKWVLFGGAWGAALGLLYTQAYPENCITIIVHCSFLGRRRELDWFYKEGASLVFPDYWNEFCNHLDKDEQKDILKAYYNRLTGKDDLARMAAAKAWSLWQARCTSLQPHQDILDHFSDPHFAIGLARIECHYFLNKCFLSPNQILSNMEVIGHLSGHIIHGRYDMVSPLQSAWQLYQSWPNSELLIVRDAGHSGREPGIIDALIQTTQKILKKFNTPAC